MKLLETLPEPTQEHLVEDFVVLHRMQDEAKWHELYARSDGLQAAAPKARKDFVTGKASEMDFDRL